MPVHLSSIILATVCAMALSACGGDEPASDTTTGPSADRASQAANAPDAQPVMGPERHILAFGDSLFAGYNVDRDDSYPAKLQAALRARGINANVVNAGVSGDTTAAGRQRLAFTLDAQDDVPELVVLELGGNDLLRQLSPTETRANLAAMLDDLKSRDIPVLLMGMRAPPNLGRDFVSAFDGLYPSLAKEYGTALVPFFLDSIYDKPQMIQADRVHPTEQGIETLVRATMDEVADALPERRSVN